MTGNGGDLTFEVLQFMSQIWTSTDLVDVDRVSVVPYI